MDLCLDEDRASAFVAGDVPAALRETIEDHIDACGTCRRLLAALVKQVPSTGWSEGKQVGRYVVRERIGRGGMGEVFRAEDPELARAVALKRLDPGLDRDVLVREARAAAQLSHPNVVTVHEVGVADGAPFLAMELVDGTTLARWLRDEPRSWRAIADVLVQAGRGLAAAHARGLVHRDFKPDNVLVDRAGRARVADFGLARVASAAPRPALSPRISIAHAAASLGAAATVLATGTPLDGHASPATALAGTPAYLAPELLDGDAPDARSDQYALGVTAFEALYGIHPFAGATAEAIWTEMAAGRVREVRGRKVPGWLDRHVRRALEVEPERRWPSVAAFVAAIERGPRRRWPYVAAGLVVANVALAGWMVAPAKQDACAAATHLVDRLWNAEVREVDALRLRSAAPTRAGTIASAIHLADDWADAWRLGAASACHAEPTERAARLGCLDRGLAELRAQLAEWQRPDVLAVDRAVTSIARLPHPDECAAHAPPPGNAPAAVIDQIAELNALERAGKPLDAVAKTAGVIAQADASGDPLARGRALVAAATIERELNRLAPAREHAAQAARISAEIGDDATTLKALIEESQASIEAGHAAEAVGLLDAAEALAVRAHVPRVDRILVARADAYKALGRTTESIATYQKAIAILAPHTDRKSRLDLAAAYGALGSELGEQNKLEEGRGWLAKGLAIEEVELGPDHPEVGRTLHDLANQEGGLFRFADADAHYRRARAIFVARYGEHSELVASCDVGLGSNQRFLRHYGESRAYYEKAAAVLRDVLPPDHPRLAVIEENLAWLDRDANDDKAVIARMTRAIAILEKAGVGGSRLADDYGEVARSYWDLEQDDKARPYAERSLALLDEAGSDAVGHVNVWLVLSELEADAGHKANAIAYAKKIVGALAGDPRDDQRVVFEHERERIVELSR